MELIYHDNRTAVLSVLCGFYVARFHLIVLSFTAIERLLYAFLQRYCMLLNCIVFYRIFIGCISMCCHMA